MSIHKKLLTGTLSLVFLTVFMIGFIIVNMVSINASTRDVVPILIDVHELESDMEKVQQALNNFSHLPSDSQKTEISGMLVQMEETVIQLFDDLPANIEEERTERLQEKYTMWIGDVNVALNNKDQSEAKRLASRMDGILNDVYQLKMLVNDYYENHQNNIENQLSFVIIASVIGSVLFIMISAILSFRIIRTITNPLKLLSKQAKELAQGKLHIKKIPYKAKDEIGLLIDSFDDMVKQLKYLLLSIKDASQEVNAFSTNLDEENASLKEISNQVAVSTDELSAGAQSISEELQDAVTLIEYMDKDFSENVQRVSSVVSYGEEAVKTIQVGQKTITEQKMLMEKTREATQLIETETNTFVNYTSNIENMAKIVSDIAKQTNLLLLMQRLKQQEQVRQVEVLL
ncbi:methyl-accepting chemotaxis protein [Bacillus carboniphilus]|uniref:Methyl-accepting chemotaxis protein n=1 Tax=Bacillus carboniphilus TaxID=86663 RepID=A0ABY9JU36_9BACI|nr:methyl-accepting chemotaxis protein [Bacillus carboniphilus]WLR42921.1 methyl-accepting chemotaxis protein [Bacillus carboniphilus]